MGALTDHHRCPRGRFYRVADALSTVAFGGLVGILLTYGIEERPRPELVLAAAALCAVLAFAVRQAVHGRA